MDRITALQGSSRDLLVKPVVASRNVGCFLGLFLTQRPFVCCLPLPQVYLKNKTSQDMRQSLGYVIILHPFQGAVSRNVSKFRQWQQPPN